MCGARELLLLRCPAKRHICAGHAAPPAIKIERLVKIYRKVPAVDGSRFRSARLDHGLLGRNGAGKDTTISMIMGLLFPLQAA